MQCNLSATSESIPSPRQKPDCTRREFLKTSSAATAVTASFPVFLKAQRKRPNIVMLIADGMNDYGFYGTYAGVHMPKLQKFKQTAVAFERAYCASPACVPSRAAVFSGQCPHKTGCYLNGSDPWRKEPFTKSESLVECFKRNGYITFGRGKLFRARLPQERQLRM